MAAGKWKLYNTAKEKIGQGLIDLDGHTFKMALFLSTSNCDTLTHDELGDLTNQHANGNGYTTGGETLTSVTWSNSSGTITFDADNVIWTASGGSITARFAVIYDDTVAGDPLLAVCLLDTAPADVTATTGNTLTITINASGIFTLSGANSN
jgi:hypothetical protein